MIVHPISVAAVRRKSAFDYNRGLRLSGEVMPPLNNIPISDGMGVLWALMRHRVIDELASGLG